MWVYETLRQFTSDVSFAGNKASAYSSGDARRALRGAQLWFAENLRSILQ
jgi:hypothetical protein